MRYTEKQLRAIHENYLRNNNSETSHISEYSYSLNTPRNANFAVLTVVSPTSGNILLYRIVEGKIDLFLGGLEL